METEFVDSVFYQLPDPALAVINSTVRLDNVQVGDVGRLLVVGTTSACDFSSEMHMPDDECRRIVSGAAGHT